MRNTSSNRISDLDIPVRVFGDRSIPLTSTYSMPWVERSSIGLVSEAPFRFGLIESYSSFSIWRIPDDICCLSLFSSYKPRLLKTSYSSNIPFFSDSIKLSRELYLISRAF